MKIRTQRPPSLTPCSPLNFTDTQDMSHTYSCLYLSLNDCLSLYDLCTGRSQSHLTLDFWETLYPWEGILSVYFMFS